MNEEEREETMQQDIIVSILFYTMERMLKGLDAKRKEKSSGLTAAKSPKQLLR
jgi:hypothetical protein